MEKYQLNVGLFPEMGIFKDVHVVVARALPYSVRKSSGERRVFSQSVTPLCSIQSAHSFIVRVAQGEERRRTIDLRRSIIFRPCVRGGVIDTDGETFSGVFIL